MLAKKLRINEGTIIATINAPKNYKQLLGELPEGVTIKNKLAAKNDFIHLFVKNKVELEHQIFNVAKALDKGGLLWISYPKGTSGMQTDLTRDKGWECLDKIDMQRLSLISLDDDWSAFLMKNEPPKAQSTASKQYQDNSAKYVDAATKTVVIPDDLQLAFNKSKKAAVLFHALPFSHRKEYVIWIVSAKQEATRLTRIQKTIDKLLEGKKNPTDK